MPEIEIRPVLPGDLENLMNLEHYYETGTVWQMERINEEGQIMVNFRQVRLPRTVKVEYPRPSNALSDQLRKNDGFLTALHHSKPVAYLCLVEQPAAQTAWVRDLVVGVEMRRQGVGSALLRAAEEWAARRNYRRMVMEMQPKNYPAIRFAQRNGFEFSGYNDHYYPNMDIAIFFATYLR